VGYNLFIIRRANALPNRMQPSPELCKGTSDNHASLSQNSLAPVIGRSADIRYIRENPWGSSAEHGCTRVWQIYADGLSAWDILTWRYPRDAMDWDRIANSPGFIRAEALLHAGQVATEPWNLDWQCAPCGCV